jgi:hypothetical protein
MEKERSYSRGKTSFRFSYGCLPRMPARVRSLRQGSPSAKVAALRKLLNGPGFDTASPKRVDCVMDWRLARN